MFKHSLNMIPNPLDYYLLKIVILRISKPGKIDPFIFPLASVKQFIKHLAFMPYKYETICL